MKEEDVMLTDEEQKLAQEAMGPRRTAQIHDDEPTPYGLMGSPLSSGGGSKTYKDGKLIVAQRKAKRQAQRKARKAQR